MGQVELPATLCAAVARCLTEASGEKVSLENPVALKEGVRCRVVRCRVTGPQRAASVILKIRNADAAEELIYAEWASLAFLSATSGTASVAPRFLGGDVDSGVLVMEDLGDGRSLHELLNGNDPVALRRVLRDWVACTARMQIATLDREEAFLRHARGLPATAVHDRRQAAQAWLRGCERLDEWLRATSLPTPAGFQACLARIAHRVAEPGPWLAFTHGDPAPTNNHVARSRLRLLDFEFGGFRHALYDVTGWYALCPLPVAAVREMSDQYRQILAHACAPARDDRLYRAAWSVLCSYRGLAMLTWIGPDVLAQDQPWADGHWTRRGAALCAASRLARAAAGVADLAPVAEFGRLLEASLRSHWPESGDGACEWPVFSRL
jgi:hypothetical protein